MNRRRQAYLPFVYMPDGTNYPWPYDAQFWTYDSACLWVSEEFYGPSCTILNEEEEEVEAADRYRWECDYAAGTAILVRTEDNGCELVELEYCLTPTCAKRCLCPWTFTLVRFSRLRPPYSCGLCVTPYRSTRRVCNGEDVEVGETIAVQFSAIPVAAGDYTITIPIGKDGGIPDEQELPKIGSPLNEFVNLSDAEGKVVHVQVTDFDTTWRYDSNGDTYACRHPGIIVHQVGCQDINDVKNVRISHVDIIVFVTVEGGEDVECVIEYSDGLVPLSSDCGRYTEIEFSDLYIRQTGGLCGQVGNAVITALNEAEWPPIKVGLCAYNPAASSSGHLGSVCAADDFDCADLKCVLEVQDLGGEVGKKWVESEKSTCQPDCGPCQGSCDGVIDNTCGDARTFNEGYECEKPCANDPLPACSGAGSFTVSGSVSTTLVGSGGTWGALAAISGGPCDSESINLTLTCTDGCYSLAYSIGVGEDAGSAPAAIVSTSPLDLDVELVTDTCGTLNVSITE